MIRLTAEPSGESKLKEKINLLHQDYPLIIS